MISDTHGLHKALDGFMPEADVLIHAGDLTMNGTKAETIKAVEWLNEQTERYSSVIFVAGNHDWFFEAAMTQNVESEIRERLCKKVIYLRDSGVDIAGLYVYGSAYTPRFFDWAFNADRGIAIRQRWDAIPAYTNILVTHGPPMGILDRVGTEHVGCADLRLAVARIKPQVHCFGHIHRYGTFDNGTTKFFNAAIVDEKYRPVHRPLVTEIEL